MTQNQNLNLARVIYDAYPHADLLPVDPDKDCCSLKNLQKKVTTDEIGDGLFRFIVGEIVEGGEGTLDGAIRVVQQARKDVDAVFRALRRIKHQSIQEWQCPDCGRAIDCSYDDPAEVNIPCCTDCDIEMKRL